MKRLELPWDDLDTEGEARGGLVRLRLPGEFPCSIYAARRVANGLEALVLELETADLPRDFEDPRSAGFNVAAVPLTPGRSGRTRMVLELVEERFRDVFRTLADDVVEHLAQSRSAAGGSRAVLARLHRWQAFLRRHGPGGLSREARLGLMGELWFLRHTLLEKLPPVLAVRSWRGPEAANQDFQFLGFAVEVKTTSSGTPHLVHVANVRQLDDSGLESLFLLLIIVEERDGAPLTLPALVGELRDRLIGPAREVFEERLHDVGFLERHRDLYDEPGYEVLRERYFEVKSGFPRLRWSDLPDGVIEVSHAVEIGAMSPWERDREAVVERIKGVLGEA